LRDPEKPKKEHNDLVMRGNFRRRNEKRGSEIRIERYHNEKTQITKKSRTKFVYRHLLIFVFWFRAERMQNWKRKLLGRICNTEPGPFPLKKVNG